MQPSGRSWPKTASQGERIEMPSYMREKGLKPDYIFYITNQIAKPIAQVFGLVVDQLPGVKAHQLLAAKTTAAREALAEELLFGDLLRDAQREATGQRDLRSFFAAKK
jgi:DNA polymerase elongation subunit (family B)